MYYTTEKQTEMDWEISRDKMALIFLYLSVIIPALFDLIKQA